VKLLYAKVIGYCPLGLSIEKRRKMIWIRLWINGEPKDVHQVSQGYIDRLRTYIKNHPNSDIVIEFV
jgi:hypothetical protein